MAPLTVMNWNANSVIKRNQGLVDLLQENEVDVAVITETYLKPGKEWSIQGYKIARWDRPTGHGGGVAILVRNEIIFQELPDTESPTETRFIESVGVELEDNTGGKLKIFAVYCPGQAQRVTRSADKFRSILSNMTRKPEKYLVAGDLNAHHNVLGSPRPNIKGSELFNLAEENDFTVYFSDKPTFIPSKSKLDIFLANFEIAKPLAIERELSDHRPVITNIKGDYPEWPAKAVELNFRRTLLQALKFLLTILSLGAMFRKTSVQDLPPLKEVRGKVEKLHSKKKAGENLLPSKLFKHGEKRLSEGLLEIITKIWNQEELTQMWIEAEVRDRKICRKSCCTYSWDILLNATYRVLSGILFCRLSDVENPFIRKCEVGINVDAIRTLREVLQKCHELKEPTYHLSMNMSALYYLVDECGLQTKLTLLIKATMNNLLSTQE